MKEESTKKELRSEVKIPEGISVLVSGNSIQVSSNGKTLTKKFIFGDLKTEHKGEKFIIRSRKNTRSSRSMAGTLRAHLKNMFRGVEQGFTYKLKICSGHFPMNVSVSGADFVIKNFLGESVPRKIKIPQDVKVKISGDIISVDADSKESAGQTAAQIEKLTTIKGRDLRIFQDGIYIIQKGDKIM